MERKRRIAGPVILAAALVAGGRAAAETAYVTDRVFLGLYAEPGVGRPFRSLETGTPLEVLERTRRWARVRTPKGEEGWVRTAYLVPEPPARVTMPTLEKAHAELKAKLEETRAALERARGEAAGLKRALEQARAARREAEAARDAVRKEAEDLRARLEGGGIRVPLVHTALAVLAAAAAGLAAGWLLLARRIRRRYGGYRIW